MTREEIIKEIKDHLDDTYNIGFHEDAWEVILKSLEQEPCEDCISRKEFIKRYRAWHYSEYGCKPSYDTIAIMLANSMPSVKAEPKQGHWIKSLDSYGNNHYTCPFCGHDIATKYNGTWEDNYCSNCGAKMSEVEQ